MTDTTLLRKTIASKGLKLNFVANSLNLTPYGLAKKIDGVSEFKQSELVKLKLLLNLDEDSFNAIFFT